MEYQQIRDVLKEHFSGLLANRVQQAKASGPLSVSERGLLENTHNVAVAALEQQDYSLIATDNELARFTERYAMPIVHGTPQYDLLRLEFIKAFRDYCSAALQGDDDLGRYQYPTSQHVTQPNGLKKQRLADVVNEYCTEKSRLKDWRPMVAKEYRAQFDLLLRIVGAEASLHLEPEMARHVKATLLRLPKNMSKKAAYRGKDLTELVAMEIPEIDRLSPVTLAKHISTYSTFYQWAVKHKRTPDNHFGVLVDDVKKLAIDREDFSVADTQRIFAKVMQAKKPHQQWGVLIAFYTGARLNEIAQLDTDDIKQVDGIWCFDFNDDGDSKRLKNESSARVVPIHSHLLKLGFLDFVESVGKGKRLFQALTYHPRDGYGRNLGRWFNESLLRRQLNIMSPTLVFHSIRHTVAQQLRNHKVSESTIKEIIGHSQDGVLLNVYATRLDMAVMQDAIEKLAYPPLS